MLNRFAVVLVYKQQHSSINLFKCQRRFSEANLTGRVKKKKVRHKNRSLYFHSKAIPISKVKPCSCQFTLSFDSIQPLSDTRHPSVCVWYRGRGAKVSLQIHSHLCLSPLMICADEYKHILQNPDKDPICDLMFTIIYHLNTQIYQWITLVHKYLWVSINYLWSKTFNKSFTFDSAGLIK